MPLQELSVQQVTSCDKHTKWKGCEDDDDCKNVDAGCNGGDPVFGSLFICNVTHGLAKEVKQSHSSFDEGLEYTCLKQESRDVIQNQLARMSTHQPLLVDAKSKKKGSLLAQSLEKSAWLLRKLINRYHGDLTLAIASYYEASQDHKHSVYGYHSISEQDLTLAMNED